MRKLTVLTAVLILALAAKPALAQISFTDTFTVTGHLGISTSSTACTGAGTYTALCPSADCTCYTATKASLHSATGGPITIPPGTTSVAVAVDFKDGTSTPGCYPGYGKVVYKASSGPDQAKILFFARLCNRLFPGAPLSFSGGGAIASATFESPIGTVNLTGWGTAFGAYSPAPTGQTLSLTLSATGTATDRVTPAP
jgi:hypothetical protein